MPLITNFTDLIVWQKAHQLILRVYQITKGFPKEELFCLTSQMKRAAISISANVAEGFKRQSHKEKRQFFTIAAASLEELKAELLVAKDLNYLDKQLYDDVFHEAEEVSRLLYSWIKRF